MKVLLATPRDTVLLAIGVAGLMIGLGLFMMERSTTASIIWSIGVVPVLAALCVEIVSSLRRGEVGLDIVAALSMSAALLFGETLAAAVVAVMYSGGTFLESFAIGRARREMSALLSRVPRTATLHVDGVLKDVPLDLIAPGDVLLIRRGDIAPVDGKVVGDFALLDQSALTGEALPVRLMSGDEVMSGALNAGEAFDLCVTRRARDSTYAGIVRLVEMAQKSKAAMARMADRYSLVFLAATVILATTAWWWTGDPVRAVAVLVVATPCPLILAVPVALVAGLSRAASFGVLVKGSGPLEALARIRTLILDKTGTLTDGRPRIVSIEPWGSLSETDILKLAGAVDQASKHPIAQAIVAAARGEGLDLPIPTHVAETAGEGVVGVIDSHTVSVGSPRFVATDAVLNWGVEHPGSVIVGVAVDGVVVGYLVLADTLRSGTVDLIANLRKVGIDRIILATGDRRAVAHAVGDHLSFDALHAEQTPDQKLKLVQAEQQRQPVMMVGDGVNDAPALAVANVGVAMGVRGAAATTEAADVVLLVDRLDRLLTGIEVAQGAHHIARQSVVVGLGLSIAGMILAALGYLTPVQGALAQEVIDVAVILNALRALTITPRSNPEGVGGDQGMTSP